MFKIYSNSLESLDEWSQFKLALGTEKEVQPEDKLMVWKVENTHIFILSSQLPASVKMGATFQFLIGHF